MTPQYHNFLPLKVVSGPVTATRVQSSEIYVFLYTHPCAAAKIALAKFSISSFLLPDWAENWAVVSTWRGWCLITEGKRKKEKVGYSGSLWASSQLCKRKSCRSLPWTSSRIRMGNSCQRVGKSSSVQTRVELDGVWVCDAAVTAREGAFPLPRAAWLRISSLAVTSLQRQVIKWNHCEKLE